MTEELLALVAARCGMVFAPNRRQEAEAAIARAMREKGSQDLATYLALVGGDASALDALVQELTVGETYFMRHPDQWALVRREVLPAFRHGRAAPRVWSAGCGTGEEAYSLAIVLAEEGLGEGALVLGTDLSAAALEKARAGSYSDWSMRGVRDGFDEDYFHHVRGRRLLVDRIRERVRFERLNLMGSEDYAAAGACGMDLILCRNVLVYFGPETVARVAARLFESLAEGGVLLTAGADPILARHAPFDVEVARAGLIYRRPRAARPAMVPLKLAQTTSHPRWVPDDAPPVVAGETPGRAANGAAAPPRDLAQEAFERVLGQANATEPAEAERIAWAALRSHPLSAPLHYVRATLLLTLGREQEAEEEARRAVYLDPSLALAHFLLGTIRRRQGARVAALRAFRNARDLCAARPAEEEVAPGAGERAGALYLAAAAEMGRLEVTVG